MLATNHGLTGVVLGAYLPLPLALPAALASHVVMDAMPHYGIEHHTRNESRTYKLIVSCDTFVALAFSVALLPLQKWRMELVGWVAYSPDGMWVAYYFRNNKSLHIKPNNPMLRFHQWIQRYERPWGIAVDLIYLAAILPIVLRLISPNVW